jgi:hypothetical protein
MAHGGLSGKELNDVMAKTLFRFPLSAFLDNWWCFKLGIKSLDSHISELIQWG